MNEGCIENFEYNGKQYGKYTKLIIRDIHDNGKEVIAYFIAVWNGKTVRLLYKSKGKEGYWAYPINQFYPNIVKVYEENGAEELGIKIITKKDRDIDKLFYGWMWYIALMLISMIFQGFVIAWIVISIVFFKWRNKVKKEETYYAKW